MLDLTKLSIEEIYKLAEGENTPGDILIELSEEKSREILQRVASNPNSPLSVLEKLSQKFPDEVANNPVSVDRKIIWLQAIAKFCNQEK